MNMANNEEQFDVIYLHEHYDWDNSKHYMCKDRECYRKLMAQKAALEEYQFRVDVDLARKENLQAIEDMIQDPRIDNY